MLGPRCGSSACGTVPGVEIEALQTRQARNRSKPRVRDGAEEQAEVPQTGERSKVHHARIRYAGIRQV